MKNIILFASGSGSNAVKIIEHFNQGDFARVQAIFVNNPHAGIIEKAKKYNVPTVLFNREEFYQDSTVLEQVKSFDPDVIGLAGFLWLIPSDFIEAFPNRIINIHPALLPKYGGKGMYGINVHRAVVENKERESGITIHLVNEKYDDGDYLFQATTPIDANDTPEEVAAKVLKVEHANYPQVIEEFLKSNG